MTIRDHQPTVIRPSSLPEEVQSNPMPLPQDLHLMYLMCSRFCHDMAAPLGAISIGLEMMVESNPHPDSPYSLLQHSIQSALHKLELMRCLCGFGASPDRPTLLEARRVLEKSVDSDKYQVVWNAPMDDRIFGNSVRLYVALFMVILEAMPRGGTITLNPDYSLTLTGPLIRFHEATLEALKGPQSLGELDSRAIVAHFVYLLSRSLNTQVHFVFDKPNFVQILFS